MLFSMFDDTSNSMKNHQMNLYAVTFLLPKSRKQNITEGMQLKYCKYYALHHT